MRGSASLLRLTLAALLAASASCGRRAQRSVPAASESAARASTATISVPSPPPLAVASGSAPSAAVFADGGAPAGYEHVAVWDLIPTNDGAAVLLLDASRTTVLPIFVGGTEALTIRLDMDGKHYDRPLTHDLLASIVRALGGQAVKAQIDDVRDDTYFGSVFVRQGERVLMLDARPSDAIAIALGSGAPLYVSRSVMLSSGVPREAVESDQRDRLLGAKRTPISL